MTQRKERVFLLKHLGIINHIRLSCRNGNKAREAKLDISTFATDYSSFGRVGLILMTEPYQTPFLHRALGEAEESFPFSKTLGYNIQGLAYD